MAVTRHMLSLQRSKKARQHTLFRDSVHGPFSVFRRSPRFLTSQPDNGDPRRYSRSSRTHGETQSDGHFLDNSSVSNESIPVEVQALPDATNNLSAAQNPRNLVRRTGSIQSSANCQTLQAEPASEITSLNSSIPSSRIEHTETVQYPSNPEILLETERALLYAEIMATDNDDDALSTLTDMTSISFLSSPGRVDGTTFSEDDNSPSSEGIERYLKNTDISIDPMAIAPASIVEEIGVPEDGHWEWISVLEHRFCYNHETTEMLLQYADRWMRTRDFDDCTAESVLAARWKLYRERPWELDVCKPNSTAGCQCSLLSEVDTPLQRIQRGNEDFWLVRWKPRWTKAAEISRFEDVRLGLNERLRAQGRRISIRIENANDRWNAACKKMMEIKRADDYI
ncbi:hypothetical protein Plec18167_006152 [Paecilomyces lecythidis]|uniref:Uncharacterized protein n=1 Tax=Paecilomyces lecythidis TaxID=3004212 RepID=A0ABR3XCW6_9EURO